MASHPESSGPESAQLIRRAATADARAIAEIGVHGWQAAYRGILPDGFLAGLSVAPREVAWRARLESGEEGGGPTWVAESSGRVIGFLASGPPRDEDLRPARRSRRATAAEVHAIYVAPDAWRNGHGRALLTTAVNYWRALGTETLVLWVLEENAAGRAFYTAMGWLPDGARQMIDFGSFSVPEVRYRLTS